MGWQDIAALAGVASGVLAGVGLVIRKTIAWSARVTHFLDDVQGEAPRPGLPHGSPGLMDRISAVEDGLGEVRADVAHLREHLVPPPDRAKPDVNW
jgi:hypothetical protein